MGKPRKWSRHHGAQEIAARVAAGAARSQLGDSHKEIAQSYGVSTRTYLRWRVEYAGVSLEQAARIEEVKRQIESLRRAASRIDRDREGAAAICS